MVEEEIKDKINDNYNIPSIIEKLDKKDDIKCSYCINCPYPIEMLSIIKFDGKYYKVCGSNKTSLYNQLYKNKNCQKKESYESLSCGNKDGFINDDIFNIDLDIFSYKIFTDYFIFNEYKKSMEADISKGNNSNGNYLNFIWSLPWTEELDELLDAYTSCDELMENHFRKKPDKPYITFGNLPIKYNRIYYQYILQSSESCINCQKNKNNSCNTYEKLYNFLLKKLKKMN